jgi:hypothetical protein
MVPWNYKTEIAGLIFAFPALVILPILGLVTLGWPAWIFFIDSAFIIPAIQKEIII